jgi:hypothetical protein
VLIGVVPDFDARHLLQACQRVGRAPTWDHHLLDVGTLAMPLLAAAPEVPRGVAALCSSLGVPHDSGRAHGALYDAQQTMRCFDRVWGLLTELRSAGAPLPPPVPRPPSSRDGSGEEAAPAERERLATEAGAAGPGSGALEPEAEQVEDR